MRIFGHALERARERAFTRGKPRRVLVLGLDCASPHLVFDQFRDELPNLSRLASGGTWGVLESCTPCITVPAWACMTSSRDPGEIGVYGFRNRPDHSYEGEKVANGADVKVKRIWDYATEAGKESVVIGVPQTFPVRPLKGHLVSGFLAPNTDSAFAYPAIFKQEVLKVVPDYPFDIKNFRTNDKADLLRRLFDFAEAQHKLLRHAITSKPWDFFMHVDMGVDRLHHAFWRYHDPAHRFYEAGNPFEHAIRDYYKQQDEYIGELVALAGDDTVVLVVSDHGVKRMDGGVCINEWLWREGWLALKTPPETSAPHTGEITRFDATNVDWSKTRAWGDGGYYGRIHLNVEGREPQGIVPQSAFESVRDELAGQIKTITGDQGQSLNTQVFKPQDIYRTVNNIAPDLMVYFGDLHWRSVGSFGHGAHYTLENDTGPDDANHDTDGMFILYDPQKRGTQQRGTDEQTRRSLMDIAPTVLEKLGIPIPDVMQGKPI